LFAYERSSGEDVSVPPSSQGLRTQPPAPASTSVSDAASGTDDGGYRLEDQAGHLLRRAHQRHTALFQDIMAALDLTPTQFAALARIREFGETTQNLLGRQTAMDPATIQGVVQRLVARGLVARRPDPADRRVMVLSLTVAGARIARDAIVRARDITRATLEPLAPAERAVFVELLRKLS
jgi:DNA-binding MarR family transcriptional regulator